MAGQPGKELREALEQVARLEAELVEMRRLEHIASRVVEVSLHWEERGKDIEAAFRGQAEAEAANAALVAALDYLKLFRAGLHGLSGKQQVDAVYVQGALDHGLGLAALSPDAGEGWLPSEVREQVLAFIRARCSHASGCGIRIGPRFQCNCDFGAALGALGGKP